MEIYSPFTPAAFSEEMECLSSTLLLWRCLSVWCQGLMRLALCHSWQRPCPNTGYWLRRIRALLEACLFLQSTIQTVALFMAYHRPTHTHSCPSACIIFIQTVQLLLVRILVLQSSIKLASQNILYLNLSSRSPFFRHTCVFRLRLILWVRIWLWHTTRLIREKITQRFHQIRVSCITAPIRFCSTTVIGMCYKHNKCSQPD